MPSVAINSLAIALALASLMPHSRTLNIRQQYKNTADPVTLNHRPYQIATHRYVHMKAVHITFV